MEEKSISVIIPVYNSEETIKNTAKSVLKDKREDIELILVVDGATDNSLEICNRIKQKDNRVKVVYQKNKGAFWARQNGIDNANGRYLMFLDSDDEYLDGIFERMIELINKYSPDLIKYQYKYFEENETFIKKKDFKKMVYPMFIDGYMLNAVWNNCIKREILQGLKFSNKRIRYGEDLLLNLKIFSNIESAVFINDILYKYNTNINSITQSSDRNRWIKNLHDAIEVYNSLFYYLKVWDMDTNENVKKVEERVEKEVETINNVIKNCESELLTS